MVGWRPNCYKRCGNRIFAGTDTALPGGGSGPARQVPNVDVTVVELATDGRPLSTADVLLSPRYPDGKVVPVDTNLATDQVRWRYWDDSEWDRQNGQGSRDVLPGLEKAPIDYMSPYPASILKLMVGYGILRLVDRGQLSLDQTYSYEPTLPDGFCGGSVSRKVRQFFDDMITVSSDASTCALIQVLRDHGGIDALNNQFTQLGMPTLKLVGGGSPARTWARWTPRSCCCSFPAGPAHYGPRQAEEPSRPRS